MNEILKIENLIKKQYYSVVLEKFNNLDIFYNFVNHFNNNLLNYTNIEMELYIKLILNKTNNCKTNVNNNSLKIFYEKIKQLDSNTIKIVDKFIELYDNLVLIRSKFFTLNFYMLKNFKKIDPELNYFLKKNNLDKNDLSNIKSIIDNVIIPYYNSLFDINYNNNFIKRISNCKNEITKYVNSKEIYFRLTKIVKLFSLKMLKKINIKIISNYDFFNMPYIKRVDYLRICYCKTFLIFKEYKKLYFKYFDYIDKINELIIIDPLIYTERFDSSVSSITKSDTDDSDIKNNNAAFLIEEDYLADTPIPESEIDNKNIINNIEYDNSINDLFIKSKN